MVFGENLAPSGGPQPHAPVAFKVPSTPVQLTPSIPPNHLSTPYTPSNSNLMFQNSLEQTPEALEWPQFDVPMTPISPMPAQYVTTYSLNDLNSDILEKKPLCSIFR